MAGFAQFFICDYGAELSSAKFPVESPTSATIDATNTLITALRNAMDGIIVGERVGEDRCDYYAQGAAVPNASPLAQRQTQFQVQAHWGADPTDTFSFTFPIADLTLLVGNSEYIDITAGEGLAIATGLSGIEAGNATVDAIKYVSRSK